MQRFRKDGERRLGNQSLLERPRADLVQVPVQTRRRERVDSARREEGPAIPD